MIGYRRCSALLISIDEKVTLIGFSGLGSRDHLRPLLAIDKPKFAPGVRISIKNLPHALSLLWQRWLVADSLSIWHLLNDPQPGRSTPEFTWLGSHQNKHTRVQGMIKCDESGKATRQAGTRATWKSKHVPHRGLTH